MSNFEDHLWQAFVAEHGDALERIPTSRQARSGLRPRRPALLTGTALGIAGLATAGVFALSATTAGVAFAVTTNPDGTVNISLSDLSSLYALNQKLAQDGVPVTAVPISARCSATGALNNPSGEGTPSISASGQKTTDVVTIDPSRIPSGEIGVLGASQTAPGQVELVFGETTPPAPSCLNSAAFAHRAASR